MPASAVVPMNVSSGASLLNVAREYRGSSLGRGKVRREMMAIGDRLERLVADGSAPLGVGGGTGA